MTRMPGALRCVLIVCACLGTSGCGDDDAQPNDGKDAGSKDAGMSGDGSSPGQHDAGAHDAGAPASTLDAGPPAPDANTPVLEDDAGFIDEDQDDGGAPAADFYPVTDGSHWVYRHSGGNTDWDEKVDISDTKYGGKSAFLLQDSPGPSGTHSKTILARVGTLVSRIHRDDFKDTTLQTVTDYDPGFPRFDTRWARANVGFIETLEYHRTETDADGVVTADANRSHTYALKSRTAKLKVPAGTFEGCLQVLRSRVRKPDATAGEGDEDMFWFCPGVGKVREEDQVTGEAEELVSCAVPDGDCP